MLYDREAPLELQIQDDQQRLKEVGSLEAIRVKILLLVSSFIVADTGCVGRNWLQPDSECAR